MLWAFVMASSRQMLAAFGLDLSPEFGHLTDARVTLFTALYFKKTRRR
jgi:hypothetical protein